MKKLIGILVFLLAAGSLLAGDGKRCKGSAKSIELTGTIACRDGATGEDCARVFRVANAGTEYSICDKSKVKLTSLSGSTVRVVGKVVRCNDGEELMIEKAAKI